MLYLDVVAKQNHIEKMLYTMSCYPLSCKLVLDKTKLKGLHFSGNNWFACYVSDLFCSLDSSHFKIYGPVSQQNTTALQPLTQRYLHSDLFCFTFGFLSLLFLPFFKLFKSVLGQRFSIRSKIKKICISLQPTCKFWLFNSFKKVDFHFWPQWSDFLIGWRFSDSILWRHYDGCSRNEAFGNKRWAITDDTCC